MYLLKCCCTLLRKGASREEEDTYIATSSLLIYRLKQYSTVQYSTVQYSAVQYSAVQYSTVQYSTVQYSTVQLVDPAFITPCLYGPEPSTFSHLHTESDLFIGKAFVIIADLHDSPPYFNRKERKFEAVFQGLFSNDISIIRFYSS
jgi:hypothetical protein